MFRAVNLVLKYLELHFSLRLGCILVFQSHAKGMSYKPHIHCAITQGGLDSDNAWKPVPTLPIPEIKKQFIKYFMKIRKIPETTSLSGNWDISCKKHDTSPKAILGYLANSLFYVANEVTIVEPRTIS
jgi:hypothetical protein